MSSGHSINRYIVRNIKIIIGVKIMKKVSRISERMERDKEILEAAIKARTEDGIKQGPVYKMINMSMEDDTFTNCVTGYCLNNLPKQKLIMII